MIKIKREYFKYEIFVKIKQCYFKPNINDILREINDGKNLQKNRMKLLKLDVNEGVAKILDHYYENLPLTDFEKRICLFDFNTILHFNDICDIKKFVNKTQVNILVLMYFDIEKIIKNIIKSRDIRISINNIHSYYVDGVFDNRLMNLSIEFNDILWNFTIPLFRKMYYKVFKTSNVLDENNKLYLNYDYEGVKECRTTFINLIKCSSIMRINTLFRKYITKTTIHYQKDNCQNLYKQYSNSNKEETIDKYIALFSNIDENKIKLLNKFYIEY